MITEAKSLFLILPYLPSSLQTRNKLRKSLKDFLNCYKLRILFKIQKKLSNVFRFTDDITNALTSGVYYKLQYKFCNASYCGECVRQELGSISESDH